MTWVDLLWFPPLMLGISIVLGTAGSDGTWAEMRHDIMRMFLTLSLGVVGVGFVIHIVAVLFSG